MAMMSTDYYRANRVVANCMFWNVVNYRIAKPVTPGVFAFEWAVDAYCNRMIDYSYGLLLHVIVYNIKEIVDVNTTYSI